MSSGKARCLIGIVTLLLLACGGGGQSDSSATPTISGALTVDCVSCSANANSYGGSGVGVWTYKNTSSELAGVPVNITGLTGQTVTTVYTNQGNDAVTLPWGLSLGRMAKSLFEPSVTSAIADPAPAEVIKQREAFSAAFQGRSPLMQQGSIKAATGASAALNDVRQLKTSDNKNPSVVLKKIVTASDGRIVNFWVDVNEFVPGKVTMDVLDLFAGRFVTNSNNVYSKVTALIGKPWGEHGYSSTLIGASQSINIVFYDGDYGSGWGGYFWPEDLYLNSQYGNGWLALYLNTYQGLYESNPELLSNINAKISTMAHEFTHMVHTYQRSILMGKKFDTWLNEMAAMSMEDWLASQILPPGENKLFIERYLPWLSYGNFNIQQDSWATGIDVLKNYYANGAFGAFLNRQYGLAYYQALFTSTSSDFKQIMDDAIRAAGGPGYTEAIRRWGASLAMLPAATTPAGYGYPGRTEGALALMPFDGPSLLAYRKLPGSVPAQLQAHAHLPKVKSNIVGTYADYLVVPANAAVTVVIH